MIVKPQEMVKIPINDFITGKSIPVNIYIKLSEEKFILIAKAGDQIELEQLKKYQNRNVDHLYVHNADYAFMINQNLKIAGVLLNHKDLAHSKKTQLLTKMSKNVLESLQRMKITDDSIETVKEVTSKTVALVEAKPDLLSLIKSIAATDEGTAAHAMAVSATSVLIAKELQWKNPAIIEKLALGGFLVDVGMKEIPPEIAKKRRVEMSHADLKEYETHPYRGALLLESLKTVPDDVVSMVYEHHENAMGQGFPRRLKDLTMHPLAKVVALANAFCELTFKAHPEDKPKTALEAIDFLEKTMGQPFNKEAFGALKSLVQRGESEAA